VDRCVPTSKVVPLLLYCVLVPIAASVNDGNTELSEYSESYTAE
jgi:hypothetical protein